MQALYDFDMVKDCTKVYRKLVDCFSWPMDKVNLMDGLGRFNSNHEEFMAIGATLLDKEVKFFVEKDIALEEALKNISMADTTSLEEADFIFVSSEMNYSSLEQIFEKAKKGTFEDPHKSATVIIKTWGENLPQKCCELLGKLELEYPLGIDMIFVFEDGYICAIPRLIKEVI